ncbi:MAG: 30S ribosome-binding factor RbfA [Acidimicrobiia bacterium]
MRDTRPRMLKVNSILREVIAEEIERLNDSRLEMVSITGVETSPNLRHSVVYIDVLASDASAALAALDRASRRLQSAIADQVRIKYTPTLEFAVDPAVTGGERIDAILRSLRGEEAEPDD